MITCHVPRLARSPDSALALIAVAPSLKSPWNRSLLLPSRIRRRLILLPLNTSTHIPDAPCVIYSSSNGQGCPDHRVPSSDVCRRMMCLKPLEVTRPPPPPPPPPWPIVALVRAMVAATSLACAMMATTAPVSFPTNQKQ